MKGKYLVAALVAAVLLTGCGRKVEFEGEPWYENVQRENKEIDITKEYSSDSMAQSWEYGRLPESGNDIAEDDTYYYVANPIDGEKLYRIKKDGDFAKEKLLDLRVGDINFVNGKVFFSHPEENAEIGVGIFCMDVNGGELEMITDHYPKSMRVVNDWIYFIDYNEDGIYKIHTEGREPIKLTEQICGNLFVYENQIYTYVKLEPENEEENEEETKWELISLDVNGQNTGSYGVAKSVSISNGYLYVLREDGLWKISMDQSEQEKLNTVDLSDATDLKVVGEELYYITEQQRLERMNLATGECKAYSSISGINGYGIFDGMIEIYYVEGTDKKVSVNNLADGSAVAFYE